MGLEAFILNEVKIIHPLMELEGFIQNGMCLCIQCSVCEEHQEWELVWNRFLDLYRETY